jgi:hypothetical protein
VGSQLGVSYFDFLNALVAESSPRPGGSADSNDGGDSPISYGYGPSRPHPARDSGLRQDITNRLRTGLDIDTLTCLSRPQLDAPPDRRRVEQAGAAGEHTRRWMGNDRELSETGRSRHWARRGGRNGDVAAVSDQPYSLEFEPPSPFDLAPPHSPAGHFDGGGDLGGDTGMRWSGCPQEAARQARRNRRLRSRYQRRRQPPGPPYVTLRSDRIGSLFDKSVVGGQCICSASQRCRQLRVELGG